MSAVIRDLDTDWTGPAIDLELTGAGGGRCAPHACSSEVRARPDAAAALAAYDQTRSHAARYAARAASASSIVTDTNRVFVPGAPLETRSMSALMTVPTMA